MKRIFCGGLVFVLILSLLAPAGVSLAAQSAEPEQNADVLCYASAVRPLLGAASVAAPVPSRKEGTYSAATTVKLSTTTEDAKIYYTTDGSKPTTKSALYSKAISVKKNITIKAIAVKSGKKSAIFTGMYKIRTAEPAYSKKAGSYTDAVSVKLNSDTKNAKIYYTTDGSKPTTKSNLYSGSIKLTKTTTIQALAVKSGMANSKVITVKYTIRKSSDPAYLNRAGYLACSKSEKKVYKAIYDGLSNFSYEIELPENTETLSAQRVMMRVNNDNPNLFMWENEIRYSYWGSYMITMNPTYVCTKSKYNSMLKSLEKAAEAVAAKAKKKKNTADQIRVVHDEIINNTYYDLHAPNAFNANGALVDGRGVCEAYSRAFQYVCQILDIPVILVSGSAGGSHMWNMVQIDGKWYHIDLTWDDPVSSSGNVLRHDYFLISDARIKKTHSIYYTAGSNNGMRGYFNYYSIPKASANYNTSRAIADMAA